jgi:hypothetical protein
MHTFIMFKCRCGRTLRAQVEQSGTQVRCWDCGKEQVVPWENRGLALLGAFGDAMQEVFSEDVFLRLVVWSLLLSLVLMIPRAGLPAAVLLLGVGGYRYCRAIHSSGLRLSLADLATGGPRWRRFLVRSLLGLIAGLCLSAPVWVRHGLFDHLGVSNRLGLTGLIAIAIASWVFVPLVLGMVCAADRVGPLSMRAALLAYLRHPVATIFVACALPAGLVLLEGATLALAWQQNWLSGFVVDLFPPVNSQRMIIAGQGFSGIDLVNPPDTYFLGLYAHGLRFGYTFLGALPASLPRGVRTRLSPQFLTTNPYIYLTVREIFSFLIFLGAGTLLAIQARWLGAIPSVASVRTFEPAEEAASAEAPPPFEQVK